MSENAFLVAMQKITAGQATIGDVIDAAARLTQAGLPAEAIQVYQVWAKLNAEHPQVQVAYFNCAVIQSDMGDLPGACASLQTAISIAPDFAPAYINLGGVLERGGQPEQGIEAWRTLAQRPGPITGKAVGFVITALKQIGRVSSDINRPDLAEAALRAALEILPEQRDVLEQYFAMRLGQLEWPVIAPWENIERKTLMGNINPLSVSCYTDDPLFQLANAARFVEKAVADVEGGEHDRRNVEIDLSNRRIRVGYVSSDLRDHAIGYLMAELFELHDRSKVEVFAYYCGVPPQGALHERIKGAIEHWRDIRQMSDDEAAAQIAADGIDILVDVNGHTRDARSALFARRPAPIIVNWLGFPGTAGSPYHQYIIADDFIVPPESEMYYSEKVLRLPCYQSNDRRRRVDENRPHRADFGLPDDAFVFCCFNGVQKFNKATVLRWVEILKRVPNSVLWLLESIPATQKRLCDFVEAHGVAPSRLVFAPKLHNFQHLARYPLADLFLDTSPYGAHTTASDALWMGVPVLTAPGRSFASRVCGSLVTAAGLPELICNSQAEYVERAVELAGDPAQLAALRVRLEAGRDTCVLFDMDRLTAELEGLYAEMCADYVEGRLPVPKLTGLQPYLEVGVSLDHEAVEMQSVEDYHGLYLERLAQAHRRRPNAPDHLIWTEAHAAAADGRPLAAEPARRKRAAAA
ncbi:N-acetylglucosamine transferase [Phenylobacterium sp. J367]|uniref:O-linked N-acetylglucosamine transferase, SPINDLY family protein n=1 Tax=Phenylobacterium sp. J367 TaxID=2898435 RepID=UPI0021507D9C|nr:N-acetylglucosamine transferase [Phenylobacterium sp. J367]MCR5879756.1 N-acetylglucosamine transferase [Phenylobacterium sp. J367]